MNFRTMTPPEHDAARSGRKLLFWILLSLLTLYPAAVGDSRAMADETITVAANHYVARKYNEILSHFENDPLKVTAKLPTGGYDRTVVEVVILAKALRLGGMDKPLCFVHTGNSRRAVEEIISGNAVISGQQLGKSVLGPRQQAKDLYFSLPVLRKGEFCKLIYCLPGNEKLLAARTVQELNASGRGIIGIDWDSDKEALTEMGITNFIEGPTFPSIIRMIVAGRADWVPMEASANEDMARSMAGYRFVPVPGIRFSLPEDRHFIVSRTHPDGEAVFAALQKGLTILHRQGFIHDILGTTGFFATDTLAWKSLN